MVYRKYASIVLIRFRGTNGVMYTVWSNITVLKFGGNDQGTLAKLAEILPRLASLSDSLPPSFKYPTLPESIIPLVLCSSPFR